MISFPFQWAKIATLTLPLGLLMLLFGTADTARSQQALAQPKSSEPIAKPSDSRPAALLKWELVPMASVAKHPTSLAGGKAEDPNQAEFAGSDAQQSDDSLAQLKARANKEATELLAQYAVQTPNSQIGLIELPEGNWSVSHRMSDTAVYPHILESSRMIVRVDETETPNPEEALECHLHRIIFDAAICNDRSWSLARLLGQQQTPCTEVPLNPPRGQKRISPNFEHRIATIAVGCRFIPTAAVQWSAPQIVGGQAFPKR